MLPAWENIAVLQERERMSVVAAAVVAVAVAVAVAETVVAAVEVVAAANSQMPKIGRLTFRIYRIMLIV